METNRGWLKSTFILILVTHYTSMVALLIQFNDWEYVSKALFWLVPGILIYLIGQAVMWFLFLKISRVADARD